MENNAKNQVISIFKKDFAKIYKYNSKIQRMKSDLSELKGYLVDEISNEILSKDMFPEIRALLLCICTDGYKIKEPLIKILVRRSLWFNGNTYLVNKEYGLRLSRLMSISQRFGYYDYKPFLKRLNDSFIEIEFTYFIRKEKLFISLNFK